MITKKEMIKKWREDATSLEPIGVMSFSAFSGLQVYGYDEDLYSDAGIVFSYVYSGDEKQVNKPQRRKLQSNESGDTFFTYNGTRIYTHDILRTNNI